MEFTKFKESPWVVLINKYAAYKLFHIEPKNRFDNKGPDKNWILHKVFNNALEAFKFLESEEAELIVIGERNKKRSKSYRKKYRGKVDRSRRIKVLERDNYTCQICGRSIEDGVKLEIDHVIPKSKGGTYKMDNLQTLCFDCNRGKRDKILPNNIKNNGLENIL